MPEVDIPPIESDPDYWLRTGVSVPNRVVRAATTLAGYVPCDCLGCRISRGEVDESDYNTCHRCGNDFENGSPYGDDLCEGCGDNGEYRCSNCRDYYSSSDYDDECNYCGERREEEENESSERVHSYNYRPTPNFLSVDDDPDSKLFLGIELEVATDEPSEVAERLYDGYGREEELLYCKEDGSINGVEIVTHPMTHAYFSERFPFQMFERGGNITRLLRYRRPSASYGLHVHVSREGFKGEAHTLRWLLLVYRNHSDLALLARRTSDEWTSFSDADLCRHKAKKGRGRNRYVAVNAQNEDTLEVRVFRSTWDEQQFRAAVDFVHASVEYTRRMSANSAMRDGLQWATFRKWLQDKPQYINLANEIDRVTDMGQIDSPNQSNRSL